MVSFNPAPRSYTRTLACAKKRWLLSNLRLSSGTQSWRFRTGHRLKSCVRIRVTPRSSKRSPKKVWASRPVTNRGEDNGYPNQDRHTKPQHYANPTVAKFHG